MLPQPREAASGPRIGRYRITGRIGKGGMGMVYRGLDETLDREVAIKTLVAEGSFDPESRRRFEVEARAAARLAAHPNIVTVHDVGEDRGILFIVMEMLPGADLDSLLKSGETLPLAEKLEIVGQVCRGLAFAHERGIVHRDIKPSNVRLLDDGTAKIMDFGIAKLGADHHITKTGMMVGTVHYMSPEQVRGQPLDGRSDVFSAGVILYELLAGERPFKGDDVTQILYKIVNEEPATPDLAALGDVGPKLLEILARALAKDPAARYPDAAAFGAALEGALELARRAAPVTAEARDALASATRALKQGHVEEALARLRGLVAAHPELVEARRALRAAQREQKRQQEPQGARSEGGYPELEATFQAAATKRAGAAEQATLSGQAPTELIPRAEPPSPAAQPAPAPTGARRWVLGVAGLLVAAAAGGVLLLRGSTSGPEAAGTTGAPLRVAVRSEPKGASVLVDGRDTGVVTDGEIEIPAPAPQEVTLTFRLAGHGDVTRTLRLPLAEGEAVSATLAAAMHELRVSSEPRGAAVTLDGGAVAGTTPLTLSLDPASEHRIALALDGYVAQEIRTRPGDAPAALDVTLEKVVPPGAVAIASGYELDVLWRGRTLAKGATSPRVELTGGRQVLTLVSNRVFLQQEVAVDVVPGGEVALPAPPLGTLNVRATPDNCEVLVNDVFLDYPPIRDRPVAAGRHTVSFRWPDGARSEQAVEVKGGSPAFVVGKKP